MTHQHSSPRPPRYGRRAFLARGARGLALPGGLALAGALGACGFGDEPGTPQPFEVERATPTRTGTATVAPTPYPTASPLPATPTSSLIGAASVALEPPEVGQGETTVITVRHEGATSASVRFLGRHYPLVRQGDRFWAVLGASVSQPLGPGTAIVSTRGAGGVGSTMETPFEVVPVERPIDHLVVTESVAAVLTPEAAEIEARLRAYEQFNSFLARPQWDGTMVQPAEGFVSTEFGQGRTINGGPVGGFHSGTDLANDAGTPVHAAAPGRVAWAGPMPIRGNSILVDHGAGVVTGYHHLEKIEVALNDPVTPETVIGLMGSTGFSTGPHLHWEMTIYGVNVDPMTWTRRAFEPAPLVD